MLLGDKSGNSLVGHDKFDAFFTSKLFYSWLLGVEVVKSWLTRNDFAGLGDLEALGE